jgi:hypothetical protein
VSYVGFVASEREHDAFRIHCETTIASLRRYALEPADHYIFAGLDKHEQRALLIAQIMELVRTETVSAASEQQSQLELLADSILQHRVNLRYHCVGQA